MYFTKVLNPFLYCSCGPLYISIFFDQPFWINRLPNFSSINMNTVEVIVIFNKEKLVVISFHVDDRGRNLWMRVL